MDAEFENPSFDDNVDDDVNDETPLINPADGTWEVPGETPSWADSGVPSLGQEVLKTAVDDYYKSMEEEGLTPALGRDTSKFELVDGRLRLKAHPEIDLVNSRTRKPLKLSTISGRRGGANVVREELGFIDWGRKKPSLPARGVKALQTAGQRLAADAAAVENIELQELGQVATGASNTIHVLETALTDEELSEVLGTIDDPPLNLREIRGLDRALQNIRGELTNNLAKLTELDDHIKREKRKLEEAESGGIDDATKRRIAERLRGLQDERASRLEAAAANRDALRSQIQRMRETINRILHEDTTLAERIRTLFREQGVTIASIVTAIGMAVTALVFALTGGSGGGAPTPTPPNPPDKGGVREWLKKQLQSLGRALGKLAGKSAAALPGIIGSVVSFVLNTLGKAVGWLASNLWAVVVALGGLLLLAAREWLTTASGKKP